MATSTTPKKDAQTDVATESEATPVPLAVSGDTKPTELSDSQQAALAGFLGEFAATPAISRHLERALTGGEATGQGEAAHHKKKRVARAVFRRPIR